MRQAKAGTTIDLKDRHVPASALAERPTTPLTIRGGIFDPISLDHWSDVTFENSQFRASAMTDPNSSLIVAYEPHRLTIRNCTFLGYRSTAGELMVRGLSIRGGDFVKVERSTFTEMAGFVQFIRTDNVQFTKNHMSYIREGLNLVGGDNIVVEGNLFENFRPHAGDHADAIQLFTTNLSSPSDTATRALAIRDNLVIAGGLAQGIFSGDELELARHGRGYSDIAIIGNIILDAVWHGITASDMKNLVVSQNSLIATLKASNFQNRLRSVGSTGSAVSNTAEAFELGALVDGKQNKTAKRRDGEAVARIRADWIKRHGEVGAPE